MGKFEDMLKQALRNGVAEPQGGAPRQWSAVFNANGALLPTFSAEAVAEMLQSPEAAARLAALPEDVQQQIRAGLASQNQFWADEFDRVMLDAATSPDGVPEPTRVLPRVYEGGRPNDLDPDALPADEIDNLGAAEGGIELPTDPEQLASPPRKLGNDRDVIEGQFDSNGNPRTRPVRDEAGLRLPVNRPPETRPRSERLDGPLLPKGRKNQIPDRNLQDSVKVVLSDLRRHAGKTINPATGNPFTMDELVQLPKEEIDRLVRSVPEGTAQGRKSARNPEGRTYRFDDGGPKAKFKDPDTGKTRIGQRLEPTMKSAADSQQDTVRSAAGFDPSTPPTTVTLDEAGDVAASISNSELPNVGGRPTQPAADRAAAAVKSLQDTFRQGAPDIMRRLESASDEEAAQLAYGAAADIVNRSFQNTERATPRAARDAVHGTAAALLSAAGRNIRVLPDSIVEADIEAIARTNELFRPRIGDQMADMSLEDYVSKVRAEGGDPEQARLQYQRTMRRRGNIEDAAKGPVETAPLDLSPEVREIRDAALAEAGFNDPTNPNIQSPREREYVLTKPYPAEPDPAKYVERGAPAEFGPEPNPEWPTDLEGNPRPPSGATAGERAPAGTAPARDPLPARTENPLPTQAERMAKYEAEMAEYERKLAEFESGQRSIPPSKPKRPFENAPMGDDLPSGAADEMPDIPEEGIVMSAPDGPPVAPKPKRGKKAAEQAAENPATVSGEDTFQGIPKSEWRAQYRANGIGTSMNDAEFEQWWATAKQREAATPAARPAAAPEAADAVAEGTEASKPAVLPTEDAPKPKRRGGKKEPASDDGLDPVPDQAAIDAGTKPARASGAGAVQARTGLGSSEARRVVETRGLLGIGETDTTTAGAVMARTGLPMSEAKRVADNINADAAVAARNAQSANPAAPTPTAGPTPAAPTPAAATPAAATPTPAAATPAAGRAGGQRRQRTAPAGQGANPAAPNPAAATPTPAAATPSGGQGATPAATPRARRGRTTPANATPSPGAATPAAPTPKSRAYRAGEYIRNHPHHLAAAGLGALLLGRLLSPKEEPEDTSIVPAFLGNGEESTSVPARVSAPRVDPADRVPDGAAMGAPAHPSLAEYMHYKSRAMSRRMNVSGRSASAIWEGLYDD